MKHVRKTSIPTHPLVLLLAGVVAFSGACSTTNPSSVPDRRNEVLRMRDDTLAELYRRRPDVRSIVNDAPGYAVFSNVGVNIIFVAAGGGHGVVEEQSGRRTYMRMGEAGIGIGLGVKDFRAVFVFRNTEAMRRFVDSGWEFSGDADAAAISDSKGGAVSASANVESVNNDMLIYQFTENGIALQATLSGTKYWKDNSLN